jgi:hypothetical protein
VEIFQRLLPSYWWTDPGTSVDGPVPIALAVMLGLALVASLAVWLLAPRIAPENRVFRRLVVRVAKWTLAMSAVGLFLLLFRWQIVPFFSKRLWLFLWILGAICGVGYLAFYWLRVYPLRVAAWADNERRRRYLPRGGQSGSQQRRRSRRHR